MKKTNQTAQKKISTQYLVQYKQRLDPEKWWTVSTNYYTGKLLWSLEDAERELERLKRNDAQARQRGYTTSSCGGIGVDCAHYREYDIIAFRIRKREVTPWETECEETIE